MKKLLKNKKILFYFCFVLVVLLMWVCGSLNTSTSSASYKSEISSSDSVAKVAKWNIANITKKKGANINLDVGFTEKITDTDSGRQGDWFLELDNQSEVSAQIDLNSKISLQLHHDTFTGLKNNDWNFLGSVNPLKFSVSLYQGSLDEVVQYRNGSTNITYDAYCKLSIDQQKLYTQIFKTNSLICTFIETSKVPTFTNTTIVGGKVVYSIDVYLKDIIKEEDIEKLNFGLGASKTSKVLHLSWEIDDSSIITVTKLSDLDGLPSNQKNESYTYVVSSTGKKYRYDSSTSKFVEITVSNEKYKRYELSTSKGTTTVSGTDPDGYRVTVGTETEIYYFNEIECDFAEYFLFSHGEPTYTFGNTMVRFSLLTESQKTEVKNRTITNNGNNGTPTSSDYNDLKKYLEKLEYPQYERFQGDYVSFASGSVYLSYGLSCKFVLDFKVVQVD